VRAKLPVATISGVTSVAVCVSLAVAAYLVYPHRWAFGPTTSWFSDLGDTWRNPRGSMLFRLDMVLVGVSLAVFFLGLSTLTLGQVRRTRSLIVLAQVCGLAGALALVLSGIYSEDQQPAHALWATFAFVALALSVTLLGWGAISHPGLPTWTCFFAFAACVSDAALIATRDYWLEWIAVPLLLLFLAGLSWCTWKVELRATLPAEPRVSFPLEGGLSAPPDDTGPET
jgi:hypothetical membrane protein